MQVSFKIRNQLAAKPEIFAEGIAKLFGEDDLFLGTTSLHNEYIYTITLPSLFRIGRGINTSIHLFQL